MRASFFTAFYALCFAGAFAVAVGCFLRGDLFWGVVNVVVGLMALVLAIRRGRQ